MSYDILDIAGAAAGGFGQPAASGGAFNFGDAPSSAASAASQPFGGSGFGTTLKAKLL